MDFLQQRSWPTVGRVLLFSLGSLVLLATVSPWSRAYSGYAKILIVGASASALTFLLTCMFVRWDGGSLRGIGALPSRTTLLRLAVGLLIGLFLVASHAALTGIVGHLRWRVVGAPHVGDLALGLLAFLSLSAREELAYRGYPLRRLHPLLGLWGSQLLVALAFGLEHRIGGNSWTDALLGAALGGLLYGMAAVATRGLAMPIGLHAGWNLAHSLRGGHGISGIWAAEIEPGFEDLVHASGWASYVIIIGLATFAFWCLWRHTSRRVEPSPNTPPHP